MSLIIDSLKKIKSSSTAGGGAVPPSLLNLSPKRGGKKPSNALIVLLVVSLIGLAIVMFIPTNDSAEYRITAPVADGQSTLADNTANTAPVQQNMQQSNPAPLPVQTENEPMLMKNQQENPTPADSRFDPTAANKKRLEAMRSLPELNVQNIQNPEQPKKLDTPAGVLSVLANPNIAAVNPSDKPVEQIQVNSQQQPVQQQPAAPVIIQTPVVETYASKKAKAEYEKRIEFNTKSSMAASALASGDNRKAEALYSDIMKIKPTKDGLNNLLTAKVRMGKVTELDQTVREYKNVADSAVISNTALEMNKYGMSVQALAFLSNYTDISGSGQIYYAAGIIQEQMGNLPRAESAYEKALDMSPADPYFLYAAARNKDIQKKYDQALSLYAKLQQVPADAGLKKNAQARYSTISEYLERIKESEKQ